MITIEDGVGLFAPQWNAMVAAFRGTGVLSGCAASATGSNRVVSVTSGAVQTAQGGQGYGGGSVTLDAGGAVDRYDLITISAAGVLAATKGTEKQKCPPQPVNTCLIAIVRVPAGASVIATGDVIDATVPIASCTPVGGIIMWSGAIANIPWGWALCNGANDTPDLRDRFVVGAGSSYAVGATGGEASVTLTVDQIPSHTHPISDIQGTGGLLGGSGTTYGFYPGTTSATGGGEAHENRPPFYALAYIMRLP